jgi:hypothetical protein
VNSPKSNLRFTAFSEDEKADPQVRSTLWVCNGYTGSLLLEAQMRKENQPMDDGSKGRPQTIAGLDLGDKYSNLCLKDTQSGEVVEEGRLRTTPEALRLRFCSEQPMRIAIEAGTHSPWVSRVLEDYAHEVLVAQCLLIEVGMHTPVQSRPDNPQSWRSHLRADVIPLAQVFVLCLAQGTHFGRSW